MEETGADAAGTPRSTQVPSSQNPATDIGPVDRDGMSNDPAFRAARIEQIKLAIEAGTYDTPERFEAAIDRMLGQFDAE